MIGAVSVAGPVEPQSPGKDDCEEGKEDAGNLEPEEAAHAAKGAQKPAHPAGDAPGSPAGCLTRGAALGSGCCLGACLSGRTGSDALTGDAACDPHAGAQSAANGVSFHCVIRL